MTKIYDFKAITGKGKEVDLGQYQGKVLMVVNTASKCGFTPQYDGLEALYQKYKDQGLDIVGFPCDQFAHQEPGSNEGIEEFCRVNHGVTTQAPTEEYKGLKAKAAEKLFKSISKSVEKDNDIKWNFTKFLINRDGTEIKRYAPTTTPEEMEADIKAFLG